MPDMLKGKTAVVTGGSRGIGRGIAEAFLGAGANVMISGTNPEKGRRTLAEIDGGETLDFHVADARSQTDTEALIAAAAGRFGGVDILVNNAGGARGVPPHGDPSDEAAAQTGAGVVNPAILAARPRPPT